MLCAHVFRGMLSALLLLGARSKRWLHIPAMSTSEFRLPISSVVAVTPSWGIGCGGTLPWTHAGKQLPADVAYFKKVTSQTTDANKMNAVVMGRDTWNSIPTKYKPLPGRLNIIISTTLPVSLEKELENVLVAGSFSDALRRLSEISRLRDTIERIVVIGGVRLFEESFFHPWFDTLHLTQVQEDFPSDTFLTPRVVDALKGTDFEPFVKESIVENGVHYR